MGLNCLLPSWMVTFVFSFPSISCINVYSGVLIVNFLRPIQIRTRMIEVVSKGLGTLEVRGLHKLVVVWHII